VQEGHISCQHCISTHASQPAQSQPQQLHKSTQHINMNFFSALKICEADVGCVKSQRSPQGTAKLVEILQQRQLVEAHS
jgi:hypothetical protein